MYLLSFIKIWLQNTNNPETMRPTASHNIRLLTEHVTISPAEKGVWTKIMMRTANLKIKMTRKMSKLLLLQKLRKRGIGVNEVEEYARKEMTILQS